MGDPRRRIDRQRDGSRGHIGGGARLQRARKGAGLCCSCGQNGIRYGGELFSPCARRRAEHAGGEEDLRHFLCFRAGKAELPLCKGCLFPHKAPHGGNLVELLAYSRIREHLAFQPADSCMQGEKLARQHAHTDACVSGIVRAAPTMGFIGSQECFQDFLICV